MKMKNEDFYEKLPDSGETIRQWMDDAYLFLDQNNGAPAANDLRTSLIAIEKGIHEIEDFHREFVPLGFPPLLNGDSWQLYSGASKEPALYAHLADMKHELGRQFIHAQRCIRRILQWKSDHSAIPRQSQPTNTSNEKMEWFKCGDFEVCHNPLAIKIGGHIFPYKSQSLEKKNAAPLRKVIRVLSIFAPYKESPVTRMFESHNDFAKALRKKFPSKRTIKSESLIPQISLANAFLKSNKSRSCIDYRERNMLQILTR